jgi:hypothetical protein
VFDDEHNLWTNVFPKCLCVVVHRMRSGLDLGSEDATPQRRHYKTHKRHYKVILKTLIHAKSPTHQEVEMRYKATKQK